MTRSRLGDERGFLERVFDLDELAAYGADWQVHQVNRTVTREAGTLRGLHLQLPPNAESKLVSCLHGRVFDVAVDLRVESPTFLEWFGCELSAANGRAMLIPEGCAHGIQTLEDDCEVLYLHSSGFAPDAEAGLDPRNDSIGIPWPLPISNISKRDAAERTDSRFFEGVKW